MALFSGFLFFSELESETVETLVDDFAGLDFVLFTALSVCIQLKLQASLALFDISLASLMQDRTVIHLRCRLTLNFLKLVGESLDFRSTVFFLAAELIRHHFRTVFDWHLINRA